MRTLVPQKVAKPACADAAHHSGPAAIACAPDKRGARPAAARAERLARGA